jgi:Protein of unknown function (DUF3486)
MSRHKIAQSISREELDAFLRELAQTPGVDGPTIQRLAREKYEIEIGHDSANNFRKSIFEKYLERLQKQRDTALFLAKNIEPGGASTFGTAISQWVGTEIFDQLSESGVVIDLKTEDGLAQAECIARIAERLSRNDVRTRKLINDAEEAARVKEKERIEKELVKRVGDGGGLSPEAVAALRSALGWTPPQPDNFAGPHGAQGEPATGVSAPGGAGDLSS